MFRFFSPALKSAASARCYFLLALLVPNLPLWLFGYSGERLSSSVFWTLLLTFLVAMLPRRLLCLLVLLLFPIFPLTFYWIGYGEIMGYAPNMHAIDIALRADSAETASALRLILNHPFAATMAVLHLVFSGMALYALRKAGTSDFSSRRRSLAMLVCLVPLCLALTVQNMGWRHPGQLSEANAMESFPVSLAMLALEVWEVLAGNYNLPLSNDIDREIVPKSSQPIGGPVLAILVVGESTRADFLGPGAAKMGRYGKELDQRLRSELGAWLPATCAGSNGTGGAVPMLVTGMAPQDYGPAINKKPSGLAHLKAYGFKTAWISNQPRNVFLEGGWDFSSWTQGNARRVPDEEILPIARHFLADYFRPDSPKHPKGVVLHFQGAHFNYEERYPANLYSSEPAGLSEEALELLRYQRAVNYQAKVLLDLAAMLDQMPWPAFFIFTSDHGQNLQADHNGLRYHAGLRASQKDAWVPALVVWNRAYRDSAHPREQLGKLLRAPVLAHRDIYSAWLALAGLSVTMPLQPTEKPMLFAGHRQGGKYRAVECAALAP